METFHPTSDRPRAKNPHRLRAGWFLLFVCGFGLASSPAVGADSPWYTRIWQSGDGLPNGTVSGVAQTRDGYLWLASGPLTRFDGVQFERFDPDTIFNENHRRVEAMLGSRDGSLWLALDHGLVVRMNAGKAQAFDIQMPDAIAQMLLETSDGTIWLACRSGMLVQIKNGALTYLSARDGWPQEYGNPCLAQDGKGVVWFAKNGQVGVFHDGRFEAVSRFTGRIQIAPCRQGGVWICANSKLMRCGPANRMEDLGTFPSEHSWTYATAMVEDRSGALWIGTSDNGLFHYDAAGFQPVPTSHRQILSLMEDREGNLWAGTGGGLNQVQPRVFNLETPETGLPFETTRSLGEDNEGHLWAVTQNGLIGRQIDGKWMLVSNVPPGLPGIATCVTADRAGSVWIGTRAGKLYRWRDDEWTSWQEKNGLESRTIRGLLAATNGDLWIAEENPTALQRLRNGQLNTVNLPETARMMETMTEGADGTLWAGTVNGRLFRITDSSVTDLPATNVTAGRSIRCLQFTSDGSLWLATGGAGLARLKDGRWDHFSSKQGLPDNYLSQVISDGLGWLWFGSDRGIFKVRERDLQAVADGDLTHIHAIVYGRSAGLPGLQANFGYFPASLRTRDGRLWMPTSTALVGVDPAKRRNDLKPAEVLVKRLVVDDQTILSYPGAGSTDAAVDRPDSPSVLKIPAKHHRLAFEFTALSFSAPEELSFRYQLDGIDESWIDAGAQRNAVYSRLPAGGYRFRVAALNSDGTWNERAAVVAFTVTPFFWQTWWFRLIGVAAFTSLVFVLARYISFRRLRLKLRAAEQEAALHKERARIARDLHDDLGTGLTGIVLLSGLALRDRDHPQKAAVRAQEILTKARQVIKSLDEIVWAVNPTNDTAADLIDYVSQFAVEFLQPAGIQCRVDLLNESPERTISSEARHNLFLIIKECLNNIIRHAGATLVRLRFTVTEQALGVTIEDDGQGFTMGRAAGDGLGNMKQRMADMNGDIEIRSEPGKGTQVSIRVPWPKERSKR